jgi:DNA polymerase-3 subunit beta
MDYSGDKDGRFTFGNRTMPTLPAADFPDYGPTAESEGRITVPFSTYRNIWRKTGFAIPTEETRYYPNGIYIHQESGAFRAVTSDGHRLAIYNFHANSAGNWPASIVPRFLCQTLARNIGKKGDGAYEIEHYGNGVMIREVQDKSMYGALNVWARLVDGTFPDYVRVIPTDFFGAVTYAKSALESALGAVKISKEKAQAVAVDIIGADTILSAQSAEGDKARADLRHTGDSHIDFRIGFNASYVGALLSAFDGESVTMRIGGTYVKGTKVKAPCNDSAVLWESPNDPGFSVVLMPMRIGKRPEKETAEAVTVPDGGANLAEAHQSKVTEGEMK